jgi:hypothetical protein
VESVLVVLERKEAVMMKKGITLLLMAVLLLSFASVVFAGGDKNQIKNPGINENAPSYGELNPDLYQENR